MIFLREEETDLNKSTTTVYIKDFSLILDIICSDLKIKFVNLVNNIYIFYVSLTGFPPKLFYSELFDFPNDINCIIVG